MRYVEDIIKVPRVEPASPPLVNQQKVVSPTQFRILATVVFKLFVIPLFLFLFLPSFAALVSAFEAHVVNVTATIEPPLNPPSLSCDARSLGFWNNHEGCAHGTGSSTWTAQVNSISSQFSGVFATTTGQAICSMLWTPNCPAGNTLAANLCKAKAQTLTDELNLASGHLALSALIALADDGNAAFGNLGLSVSSTVDQSLIAIEMVLKNVSSTKNQLKDAAYVAERIYSFYENENPFAPACIVDPKDIPACFNHGGNDFTQIITNNSSTITNNVTVSGNTGSNSTGGGGGEAIITTGNGPPAGDLTLNSSTIQWPGDSSSSLNASSTIQLPVFPSPAPTGTTDNASTSSESTTTTSTVTVDNNDSSTSEVASTSSTLTAGEATSTDSQPGNGSPTEPLASDTTPTASYNEVIVSPL